MGVDADYLEDPDALVSLADHAIDEALTCLRAGDVEGAHQTLLHRSENATEHLAFSIADEALSLIEAGLVALAAERLRCFATPKFESVEQSRATYIQSCRASFRRAA